MGSESSVDGKRSTASINEAAGDHSLSFLRALSNAGVSVLYCDPELRFVWTENLPPIWSREDIRGRTVQNFLPHDPAQRLTAAHRAALASGMPQTVDVSLPDPAGMRWFSAWIDLDRAETGQIAGLITTVVDTTEQKWREQTLRALLREVAHRSKNLLAIIQSITTQTGRHSGTIEAFMSRFHGRLQSLSSTQDLVTSSNWRGANLYDLVIGQVGRYTTDPARSISFEGENPYLNPNAALHIGLALHELAVNSVSYGALARPDGSVTIRTTLDTGMSRPGLTLTWSEVISIGDQEIGRKRFGSVALERVVPASLNGTSRLSISSERLDYQLTIPAGNFEIE